MIDIHTHITPNVDDGSSGIGMSLEMLRSEVEQGGNKVFLTPHSFAFETKRPESVYAKMKRVQEISAAEGIPLQVYQGCEIYTNRDKMGEILQDLQSGRIPSMNGTRYVMAEFSVHKGDIEDAKYCLDRYLEEYRLLCDNAIESPQDFAKWREGLDSDIAALEQERYSLRCKLRRVKSPEEETALKDRCKAITKKITPLRKQKNIAARIEKHIPKISELMEQEREMELGEERKRDSKEKFSR